MDTLGAGPASSVTAGPGSESPGPWERKQNKALLLILKHSNTCVFTLTTTPPVTEDYLFLSVLKAENSSGQCVDKGGPS